MSERLKVLTNYRCQFRKILAAVLCVVTFVLLYPVGRFETIARVRSSSTPKNAELHQALLDLTSAWTVMCVAAHPDDEDGATLTLLRRKYGVNTVSLFSTFGEGGQNAVGPELYEELGAIRAQETVKASEIQGSKPYFLGLKDFGFSKSAEEAFRIWGHDEALRRMVLRIRNLRPDVIITNHNTSTGHGHHQATGRLVLEAFDAAADPKRFPDQLETTRVWQVQRLFVRLPTESSSANKKTEREDVPIGKSVAVDRNELDPVRGTTYAEQALLALQQHATQGPWPQSLPKEGLPPIRYGLVREARLAAQLPKNAKTFTDNLASSASIATQMASLTLDGRPLVELSDQRERVLYALISASKLGIFNQRVQVEDEARQLLMATRFNSAFVLTSGLSISISTHRRTLVPGVPSSFSVTISNNGTKDVWPKTGSLHDASDTQRVALKFSNGLPPGRSFSSSADLVLPANAQKTVPHEAHLYDNLWRGYVVHASIPIDVGGTFFILTSSTRLDVAPAVEFERMRPNPYILTPENLNRALEFSLRLKNNLDKPFSGAMTIANPSDHITDVGADINLRANETRDFAIRTNVIPVDTPDERRTPRNDFGPIVFSVKTPGSTEPVSERETKVVYANSRVLPGIQVGYVRSFDYSLRDALTALGVQSRELTIEDIRTADLSQFDTIIIDNRGYQAHPELIGLNSRLLEFASKGGTLIVCYHRTNEWNPDRKQNRPSLSPYPLVLGDKRVTDENAHVTFAEPNHPLLNLPNKIGPDDFKGWIQERGLYYPKSWDSHYHALFAMNDAGEEPLRGGLLVADYGRGHYIYTSMVWYRQLRAGIPGGYRMFANMIGYGKTEGK